MEKTGWKFEMEVSGTLHGESEKPGINIFTLVLYKKEIKFIKVKW